MVREIKNYFKLVYSKADKAEVNSLYSLLYDIAHDLDGPPDLFVKQTQNTFKFQWAELSEGEAMLSDQWFRANVAEIIPNHELLIDRGWFANKKVLDLGCGGGRWSYGLAQLGAHVTAVDINQSALDSTEHALKGFKVEKRFIRSSLEELPGYLDTSEQFDLVWSWGVIHHCRNFNLSLKNALTYVKPGGLIYLYLYGRESVSYVEDISMFKKRLHYYSLKTWQEKKSYLLQEANGDERKLHQLHDMLAPLINRRLQFDQIKAQLEEEGFTNVLRTVNHTELFIRAVKRPSDTNLSYLSSTPIPDHWLNRYSG